MIPFKHPYPARKHSPQFPKAQPTRLVGYSKDGQSVFDRPNSHHHLSEELLREAISKATLGNEAFLKIRVHMGRIVGVSTCVATTDKDRICFARRINRRGLTRFVRGREAEPCASVILIFKRIDHGYLLITGFVGDSAEPEPWDEKASAQSVEFWSTHALIWGSEEVSPETETVNSPW
jgi:hypothetical protein